MVDSLHKARRSVRCSFDVATPDSLLSTLSLGTTMLHYSGHGGRHGLAFEDGEGASFWLTPDMLRKSFATADCEGSDGHGTGVNGGGTDGCSLRVAVLSACESEACGAAIPKKALKTSADYAFKLSRPGEGEKNDAQKTAFARLLK